MSEYVATKNPCPGCTGGCKTRMCYQCEEIKCEMVMHNPSNYCRWCSYPECDGCKRRVLMLSKDSGQCQQCDELFAGFLNASEKTLPIESKSPEPTEDYFKLPNGKFLHLATISSVRCIEEMYGHGVDIFTGTGPQQWEFKSKPDQVKFKRDLDQARESYLKRMKIPIPEEAAPFVRPPRIPPGRVMKPKDKTEDLEVSFEPDGPDGHEKWRLDLHDWIDDHEHYTDKIEWDSDSVPKLREQVQGAIEHLQIMDHFLIDVQSAAKLRNREKRVREAAEAKANKKAKTSA